MADDHATWSMGGPEVEAAPGGARYRLLQELGRGAMGRVWLARDTVLDREVALKEVLPGALSGTVQRFLAEARLTAGLQHPAIVPVYDAGQHADGTLYYVMKRVRGQTLEAAVTLCADLTARLKLLDRVISVAQALSYAHAQGLLHRDVKPENIMIGERGETLLVDRGLATRLDSAPPGVVGTPRYMSPEQARGEPATVRSDIWAVGGVLFFVCTGRPPHDGELGWDVVAQVATTPPGPVRGGEKQVPGPLAAIVDRALAFDPANRYPSLDEMVADLEAWRQGARVGAYRYAPTEALLLFARQHRALIAVLGVGLSSAAGAAGLGFVQVQAERDVAEATLADSLERQALAADRADDRLGAVALAVAALEVRESPAARGLLMRHWGTFPLQLAERTPDACVVLSERVCASAQALTALDGSWTVPVGGVSAMAESATHLLVAEPGRVVLRSLQSGAMIEAWPATGVIGVALHPDRPWGAWHTLRGVALAAGAPPVSRSTSSVVKHLG